MQIPHVVQFTLRRRDRNDTIRSNDVDEMAIIIVVLDLVRSIARLAGVLCGGGFGLSSVPMQWVMWGWSGVCFVLLLRGLAAPP